MSAEQPAAEQLAAGQDGGAAAELDLTNAHLPSLAEVPGLTQQLTVSMAAGALSTCWKHAVAIASAARLSACAARPVPCLPSLLRSLWCNSPLLQPALGPSSHLAPHHPPTLQSLDLTANRLRSLEPCLLALTGLRRLCLRQNLVSQPGEVEALASAPGACCSRRWCVLLKRGRAGAGALPAVSRRCLTRCGGGPGQITMEVTHSQCH